MSRGHDVQRTTYQATHESRVRLGLLFVVVVFMRLLLRGVDVHHSDIEFHAFLDIYDCQFFRRSLAGCGGQRAR
jgi:hypothetical protein